jgi:hypothetical protein
MEVVSWVSNSRKRKEEKGRAYLVGASPGAKGRNKTRRQSPAKGPRKNWQRATALARPGVADRKGRPRASKREG